VVVVLAGVSGIDYFRRFWKETVRAGRPAMENPPE
jgi:hypothetical protein